MNTKTLSHRLTLRAQQSRGVAGTRLAFCVVCQIILVFCLSTAGYAQGVLANTEEDTQFWNDIGLAVALTREIDFNLVGTLRLGRDMTHLVDRRVGVGFTFRVGKYLFLTPSYLNIATRPFEGRKGNENRLVFSALLRFPVGKFVLSNRNQFERRLRFPIKSTRYRNRLQIDRPVELGGTQLTLFAADEVQYDWSFNDWMRNRFFLGVSKRFNKHFTGDVYYMRQNDGVSRPGDLHVLGLTYRLRL